MGGDRKRLQSRVTLRLQLHSHCQIGGRPSRGPVCFTGQLEFLGSRLVSLGSLDDPGFRVSGVAVQQFPSTKVLRAEMPTCLPESAAWNPKVPEHVEDAMIFFCALDCSNLHGSRTDDQIAISVKADGIATDSQIGTQRMTLEQRPAGTVKITKTSSLDSKSSGAHATSAELDQDT
ncbi:hypothetical protein NN561_002400 [Cricetulus griseus]